MVLDYFIQRALELDWASKQILEKLSMVFLHMQLNSLRLDSWITYMIFLFSQFPFNSNYFGKHFMCAFSAFQQISQSGGRNDTDLRGEREFRHFFV